MFPADEVLKDLGVTRISMGAQSFQPAWLDALGRIQPSATVAINSKATEMKRAGQDVISLAAGEPDFDTPEHVRHAAIRAINEGKTRYTAVDGITELKEAVAQKFRRDNHLEVTAADCFVSSGGKQIIFNALIIVALVPLACFAWVSLRKEIGLLAD